MKINSQDVEHVAKLARLELTDADVTTFVDQIGDILDHVDSLKKVDTQGVVGTSHALSLTNAFREDEVSDPADRDVSLANAPESEDGCFVVPKII